MAAEKRKVKKWGGKTLLALLGLAAAGAFGFFSIFNTVRVAAAEPALSENEANEAASVTITDAELEQLLSGELTLDSLTRTGTDEAPAASEAQGTAAGEQPARMESEAAASSEPEDSASGTEQSAASSSEAPAEKKQQEAACEAEVKALIQQTYALKAIAEKGLNSSISAAKAEYKTLPAGQQTKTKKIMICLSKTGELTSLQSYCDKEMGRIVSQLRITKGVECAIFLYQTKTLEYKVSLRSNGKVDVAAIASYFGGGGHVRAAGCTMQGTVHDCVNNLAEQIEKQLIKAE